MLLVVSHLREKIVDMLVATPAAQDDEFLLTLKLIDTLKPRELRLLEASSEVLPNTTMIWLDGLIKEARRRVQARTAA